MQRDLRRWKFTFFPAYLPRVMMATRPILRTVIDIVSISEALRSRWSDGKTYTSSRLSLMSIFRRVVAGIEVDGIREIRFVRLGPILARNWPRSRVRPLQNRRFLLILPSSPEDFTKFSLFLQFSICIDKHSLRCHCNSHLNQYMRNERHVSTYAR